MMNDSTDNYVLSNGVTIPCVGFGTWQIPDDASGLRTMKIALDFDYRHIDTAAIYGNERSVGRALKEHGTPRKEVFLTSKLWNSVRGYDETLTAFQESLDLLETEYLDLYLIHWPNPKQYRADWAGANAESWRAMERLYEEGKVRAIGVSNFLPHHLDALLQSAKVPPQVNQIRICPGETQAETVAYCNEHNILIEAYSPMGSGKIFSSEEIRRLAAQYNRTVGQVCVRWSLQNGFLPLPKAVMGMHIFENIDVFDFTIKEEDMARIAGLTGSCGESTDPDSIDW